MEATAVNCREFGSTSEILPVSRMFVNDDITSAHIVITGLDSMAPRRQVFEAWRANLYHLTAEQRRESILIDGRLTMEMYEIFAIQASDPEQMDIYDKVHLFDDSEAQVLDCTTKQSPWCAMGIAADISSILCSHLVNCKWQEEIREMGTYTRMYYPLGDYKRENLKPIVCQTTTQQEAMATEQESVLQG